MLTSASALWSDFVWCFSNQQSPHETLLFTPHLIFSQHKGLNCFYPDWITPCPSLSRANENWSLCLARQPPPAATQALGRASWAWSHPLLSTAWVTARLGSTERVPMAPPGIPSAASPWEPWLREPCQTWWPVCWNGGDVNQINGYLTNRSQVPKHLAFN